MNSDIMRELAGKKLKSKLRNTLDDLSEKTKIPIGACRRHVTFPNFLIDFTFQFDNLKRVYTLVIERFREGKVSRMTDTIQQHFLLSKELAEFVFFDGIH